MAGRMIRVNHLIPERQFLALRAICEESGFSMADLVRRSIDLFLVAEGKRGVQEREGALLSVTTSSEPD